MGKQYIITKKVAKHGHQAIFVIPKFLQNSLKPGTVAQITIEVLDDC